MRQRFLTISVQCEVACLSRIVPESRGLREVARTVYIPSVKCRRAGDRASVQFWYNTLGASLILHLREMAGECNFTCRSTSLAH
jgi:hypothetical protein